jgi:hypothetical protein
MAIPVTIVDGTIDAVVTIENIDNVDVVNDIINIETLNTVNTVAAVTLVADVTNVSTLDTVNTVAAVTIVADVTNVSTLDTVNTVTTVGTVNAVTIVDKLVKVAHGALAIASADTGIVNTAKQVTAATAVKFVTIRSHYDNSVDNPIWVGGSTVDAVNSANGYPLDAGEILQLPIENANLLYVASIEADQNYSIIAV